MLVGRVPWETVPKARGIQKGKTSLKKDFRGARTGCYCVSENELTGKAIMAEQGAYAKTWVKKECTTFGRRDRQLGKSTRMLLLYTERKLERQKSN